MKDQPSPQAMKNLYAFIARVLPDVAGKLNVIAAEAGMPTLESVKKAQKESA